MRRGAGDRLSTGNDPAASAADAELARLIAEHSEVVYRLARSVVRDPALADDVTQETMIKAWRALPDWGDDPIPRAWLLRVARNTAISLLRSRRDDVRSPETLPDASGGPATDTWAADRAAVDDLWLALGRLDETSRSLVVLRELSGLTYEEIAEVLDLPLSTVKTRLFRARRTLQAQLEEWRP
ncbi:MAG TPA: RNA polymerase sigma factor [Acidimicrobiales bacterium]|nr:RNA polymerase sigma factor [Acidimicrobiales bacterium]